MLQSYFGYIRVSTAKQGEQGVSLQEQRAAIEQYATRQGIQISRWFEERETAAKRGRPVFDRMMALLRQQKAVGVIIHKIDRSARNLRDWSDLGEMMDGGIQVHFANEALDLNSRGGRLSADIQAVVAADFIRNLREEARKGMRGRFKQGFYPLPAPIGYLDRGGGQPKSIDPIQGPLVKRMFELYTSGLYGQRQLQDIMHELGLRTKRGQRVKKSTFAGMLSNPFYYGLMRLKATNEVFEGRHDPLISQSLFRAARAVALQRLSKKVVKHDLSFRRSIRCGTCGYNLIGEISKGIVYYRCRTKTCGVNAIRDDLLTASIAEELTPLQLAPDERKYMQIILNGIDAETQQQRANMIQSLTASLGNVHERLSRLTDAFLDGVLDRDVLQAKQKALLEERKGIEGRLAVVQQRHDLINERLKDFLDFAASVRDVFVVAAPIVRQQILRKVTLRVTLTEKKLGIVKHKAYELFASRRKFASKTHSGLSPVEDTTTNAIGSVFETESIGEHQVRDAITSATVQSGGPLQSGQQTETKELLLRIGHELMMNDSETTYR
jgi:DNA invertase Pin-like site-specific DNA recombinase